MKSTYKERKQEKAELLKQISEIKSNQEELELTLKEKWHDVKDFVAGNDYYKLETFNKWKKNTYSKEKSSLNRKLTIATKKYDEL